MPFASVSLPYSHPLEQAIDALRAGRPVILTDADDREHEGDLVYIADTITAEQINFMAIHGRGLICLALAPSIVDRLHLPLMTSNNQAAFKTAFTVSIEARQGVSTGISAQDRAHTIRAVLAADATAQDYVSPGHVFPLRAESGGVLTRAGHTEGSVDLATMAGFQGAAVICEILNNQGESCRGADLQAFAHQHQIPMVSIDALQQYRLQHEILAKPLADAALPTEWHEEFEISAFESCLDKEPIIVLKHRGVDVQQPVLTRIHSECLTGDVFGSQRCDCGWQLKTALAAIAAERGILIYLKQEGRGIGLVNKLKAYQLQSQGHDTVTANLALGFAEDQRHYLAAAHVLKALGVTQVALLSNNPRKIEDCQRCGLQVQRRALQAQANAHNQAYLQTKRVKLGHLSST